MYLAAPAFHDHMRAWDFLQAREYLLRVANLHLLIREVLIWLATRHDLVNGRAEAKRSVLTVGGSFNGRGRKNLVLSIAGPTIPSKEEPEKSMSLSLELESSRRFSSLRSLWMMPWECRRCRPSAASQAVSRRCCRRLPRGMYWRTSPSSGEYRMSFNSRRVVAVCGRFETHARGLGGRPRSPDPSRRIFARSPMGGVGSARCSRRTRHSVSPSGVWLVEYCDSSRAL